MNFSNIVKKKFNGSENRAKAGKTLKKSAKTFASFVQVREKEKRSRGRTKKKTQKHQHYSQKHGTKCHHHPCRGLRTQDKVLGTCLRNR
mgnify:CR=1 FL=1